MHRSTSACRPASKRAFVRKEPHMLKRALYGEKSPIYRTKRACHPITIYTIQIIHTLCGAKNKFPSYNVSHIIYVAKHTHTRTHTHTHTYTHTHTHLICIPISSRHPPPPPLPNVPRVPRRGSWIANRCTVVGVR